MFNRVHLLIVSIAIGGALVGLLAGSWLRGDPSRPLASGTNAALAIGTPRPDLQLPDLDGHVQNLTRWDGKLVLINFWASWCGPCIEEMPLLDRAQQRHAARGLQVVGIAADDATATKRFLASRPVRYPILIDDPARGHDASLQFGDDRSVLPYSVLVDRSGRVVAQRFGNFSEATLERWLQPFL